MRTYAVFDAEIGAYATSEAKLAPKCFRSLSDRGFWSFELWVDASETGSPPAAAAQAPHHGLSHGISHRSVALHRTAR